MFKLVRTLSIASLTLAASSFAEPIKLHPANPHYYLFNDQPTVLITSAEHYGAVINGDFDYVAYFDALKSFGLNYTRIYPGAMFEPQGKFGKGNTLGPKPGSLIVPWARSTESGYNLCGNKFDLDRWNPEYFTRLKDFVARAAERGIVVEICFFNAQYSDTWPISPLYHENNIQGVGKCDYRDAQTLKCPDVVQRESDYVRKITEEVNSFDNVILEICDEPALIGTPLAEAGPWISHLIKVIKDAENNLSKKHLIAQQLEGQTGGPVDFSDDPDVSIIVTQYVWLDGDQMGGMQGLDREYDHKKPIEFNETNYYPFWYKGDKVGDSRVEAWEFMVGGGGSFNQLNGVYTVDNPAGNTPDNLQILNALRNLKHFIESFDFLKMQPDRSFVMGGVPAEVHYRSISQPGQQYALYFHHSKGGIGNPNLGGDAYTAMPGDYSENLDLSLTGGRYKAEWVDPASGSVLGTETFSHSGGNRTFTTPRYHVDIALRIKRVS